MPELPEVEVVRRSLSNFITGLKIKKVRIFNNNLRYRLDIGMTAEEVDKYINQIAFSTYQRC